LNRVVDIHYLYNDEKLHPLRKEEIVMSSGWLTHNRKRVLFCDYAFLDYDKLKEEVALCDAAICQEPENSVLVVTDIRGTPGTPPIVELLKQSTAKTRKYVRKSAAIGIGESGPRKMLFDLIMRFSGQNIELFDDIDQAKNWVTRG
jgi:hypothetical protein